MLAILPIYTDIRLLAVTLPAGLMVASARALDGRLRAWKPAMLIGDASYAIYLAHPFVVLALLALLARFGTLGDPLEHFPSRRHRLLTRKMRKTKDK